MAHSALHQFECREPHLPVQGSAGATWPMDSTLRPDATARLTNSTRGVPNRRCGGCAGSPAHVRIDCTQPCSTCSSSGLMPRLHAAKPLRHQTLSRVRCRLCTCAQALLAAPPISACLRAQAGSAADTQRPPTAIPFSRQVRARMQTQEVPSAGAEAGRTASSAEGCSGPQCPPRAA